MIPSYTKTTWENGTTPINEDNLNNIEDQLETITDEKDTATATGTSLTLTDCVADTCKVKSNSKNMIDNQIQTHSASNVTITRNGDGSITLNGTAGANVIELIDIVTLKSGKTYTLSAGTEMATETARIDMRETGVGGSIYDNWYLPNKATETMATDKTLYVVIRIQSGASFTNKTIYPQLEEGSTATSYNPYNTEVGIYGKNLINSSLFKQGDFSSSNTTTRLAIGQKLYLRAGTYTISTNLNTNVYRYYINTLEGQIGSTYGSQKYNSGWQTSSSFTFTLSSSEEGYFAFVVGKIDGSTLLAQEMANYSFQLENGSTATTYEKFEGQYLTLTPDETKSAFTYDSLTNILSNGSVTIEYNTQSRLLNNDDVLDIVEPVKEYVDEKTDRLGTYIPAKTSSSDEIRIGTYNGKPLYRQVRTGTLTGETTNYNYGELWVTPLNIETMVKQYGVLKTSGTTKYVKSMPCSSIDINFFYSDNRIRVYGLNKTEMALNTTSYILIIEYTKTTDA